MTAVSALDEDECYLAAILEDRSGIDLFEFAGRDPLKDDDCFRVRDYQWRWWRCESTYQIDWCSRDIGKTQGIILRAVAFPLCCSGQEMLLTAPQMLHLNPLTSRIAQALRRMRLTREILLKSGTSMGIRRTPQWEAEFMTDSKIISRLPHTDGLGVKGVHASSIEMDEAQDYPENGWVEIIESMRAEVPGANWRVHGVSRGIRDRYYRYTLGLDPSLPWYVHRYMAMNRPMWSPAERVNKIALYGGSELDVNYRRNIFGMHGDISNPLFVQARLMTCVRFEESAWAVDYNTDVYFRVHIMEEQVRASGSGIEPFFGPSRVHLSDTYRSYWAGIDVGFTRDPSEILVFGETVVKGEPLLRLLSRIHMQRISAMDQVRMILHVFEFYGDRLRMMAMDKTGVGLPLFQVLQDAAPPVIIDRIKGYGFSEKRPVTLELRSLDPGETLEDAVISKNVIEYASDELRSLVDARPPQIELPNDTELLMEWQGQEVQYVRDIHGSLTRAYGNGSFHTLDAAKLMILGRNLASLDRMLAKQRAPVLEAFV